MNLLENVARSVTGSVDKAILCVKKPVKAKVPSGGGLGALGSVAGAVGLKVAAGSAVDLQADLVSSQKGGLFNFLNTREMIAGIHGFHVLKVKYNPSRIQFDSRAAGDLIQPGPGGAGTNMLSQITIPSQTYMSFELLFDEENHQDAFMFEKVTNLSAGALVSDIAGITKNVLSEGYTVRPEVEALIGLLTQSETRQVVFCWNSMAFAGEVVSVDAKYTMFNPIGNPIRATVRFTVRQGDSNAKEENKYWDKAFDNLDGGGSGPLGKIGNVLNFK